ncbi:MAG: hypothetical protein ONB44_09425 [candidate division KSB1 bacterium]|nr:hypothetical protein [candidate division KSB1 bacterium]MDZ7302349.1 hypothetical protein [candidate division KSB1 bacterium]MDZ7311201.1 hypothetical protein [candidate division KSB1 bacterium]
MKIGGIIHSGPHHKLSRCVIYLFLWLLTPGLVELQQAHGQQGPALRILDFSLINAQILRISDFNITGSGSIAPIFTLVIENRSGAPATEAILRFELRNNRFTGTIVEASTRPFPMGSGQQRSFTYQDFRGHGTNADVTIDEFKYNAQSVDAITDAVLKTGRLPSGRYQFVITLSDAHNPGAPPSTATQILDISNPTTLDLISPGAPAGRGECLTQFGLLPQFKWDSNADRFQLIVCEALPGNSSPEVVMQNEPRLRQIVQRGVDFWGSPSFMYPSGGLPLEYGKTYYWQVHAILESPSGELRLPSEIWCFHISPPGSSGGEVMLQQLMSLLNSREFEALFREGRPLHRYRPTGEVTLNGRRIDLSELIAFLRNHPLRKVSLQVE